MYVSLLSVYTRAMCNAWYLTSSWTHKLYHVHFQVVTRPADGHWHSYEVLRHCCYQCFGDLVLQSAKIHASASLQRILVFLQEFAANLIANGTSFNIQPGVCVGREYVWRKYPGGMSGKTAGEQDILEKYLQRRNVRYLFRITGLYV